MLAGIFDDFRKQMKAHVARRERAIEAEIEERGGQPSCEGVIAEANAEVEARLSVVSLDIGAASLAPARRDKISYA